MTRQQINNIAVEGMTTLVELTTSEYNLMTQLKSYQKTILSLLASNKINIVDADYMLSMLMYQAQAVKKAMFN